MLNFDKIKLFLIVLISYILDVSFNLKGKCYFFKNFIKIKLKVE